MRETARRVVDGLAFGLAICQVGLLHRYGCIAAGASQGGYSRREEKEGK
jgi:hypothetical protein